MIKLLKIFSSLFFLGLIVAVIGAIYVYTVFVPKLPSTDNLEDTNYQVPLRIYDRNEKLLAEYGEHKRIPAKYEDFPANLVNAFVSAEDNGFWEHHGVDPYALAAAAFSLATTGRKTRGGSTITMQVARNFYLTKKKTYSRKLNEILLALKIDSELSKQKIMELYLNKIFMGHRSYGVVAAAQVYYGKKLADLSIAEAAMIAGLPKAPSKYNPITNPERALLRRNHILSRMNYLKYISDEEYDIAKNSPVTASLHKPFVAADARYVTELVRSKLYEEYGDALYTLGIKAYTTIDGDLQVQANRALRKALLDYDRRHGYRGITAHVDLSTLEEGQDPFQVKLVKKRQIGNLQQAVVEQVEKDKVIAILPDQTIEIPFKQGIDWARKYINENSMGPKLTQASEVLNEGDVIWVEHRGDVWLLASVPAVEGALISISPNDGAINSMVGGFDFFNSKFNRATQAKRQPGSNFKPFIYSAALEYGFTAATLVNDAPVVFEDESLEASWRPENYSGRVFGPTRLREGLVKSRNLVSIRVLRAVGLKRATEYAQRFGFKKQDMPYDLSLSLGSGAFAPLEIVRGYAVFANGGFLINPYLISRVEDRDGHLLKETKPLTVCQGCEEERDGAQTEPQPSKQAESKQANKEDANIPQNDIEEQHYAPRVITPQNAYIMRSMMREVVRRGTAVRAKVLKRTDFAGKTGTTNDQHDAWFSGFNDQIVTSAWVGFDNQKPLGRRETGSRAALPMWVDYMREAFKGMPENPDEEPDGIVTVRIDEKTGERVTPSTTHSRFEIFRKGHEPKESVEVLNPNSDAPSGVQTDIKYGSENESLF